MRIRKRLFLIVFVAVLGIPAHGSAEPVQTFLRIVASGNILGYTELAIHKAYGGQSGPIRDIIPMPDADIDGYPRVEIRTSGPIRAERERGRVVIESTGPGRAEVDLFVVHNQKWSWWPLQMADAAGVGATLANVSVRFAPGVRGLEPENGLVLRTESRENRILQGFGHGGWHADAEVPQGVAILLRVSHEPIPQAPLWMVQASLATALLALASSGLLWKSRRSSPPLHHN